MTRRNQSKSRGVFATHKDARAARWHSRRHQTNEAQNAARVAWQVKHTHLVAATPDAPAASAP